MVRLKVCCLRSIEEARLAVAAGASAVGLVSEMPSGPGVVSEEEIARIAATVPPGVSRFLLTCAQDADLIVAQQERTRVDTLQLCDAVSLMVLAELKERLPGVRLVQVIHVDDERNVAEAVNVAPYVDALLLDSGRPSLPVKELGGTGRVHNWEISRRIRDRVEIPLFLAGGLTPENAGEAMRAVEPYGLDVCSGVRTDGRLDGMKLRRFVEAMEAASRTSDGTRCSPSSSP